MCEVVLLYLPVKVDDVGLNRKEAALVMSIYGGVFAVSQIIVGILADFIRVPTTYILMFSAFSMSLISIAITFCYSFSLFALAASLFAICTGFGFPLKVVLVASILGVKNLNKGYSPLCLLIGMAQIIYPLISGSLFKATQSFDDVFYLAAGFLFMSFIFSSGLIYMQRKSKFYE